MVDETVQARPAFSLTGKLVQNAKVLASRLDILPLLPKNIIFVEVGVALGDFTDEVLKQCNVSSFIAIDLFCWDKYPDMWRGRAGQVLSGRLHVDYYRERFQYYIDRDILKMLVGNSIDMLRTLPDKSADVIYVDANHNYPAVKAELSIIQHKIKDDGIIIFNDYLLGDGTPMTIGVVPAVNEFMLEKGWEMIYFALHPRMFCDVAIRKLL
ncbi:MAG TPA: class I SAM-dependent methyltransferase [Stellaceae bacterium]|jgi:hypothetical protein|nr:class I SAM-dependent methyltransferase [Stellaceae bacterium]